MGVTRDINSIRKLAEILKERHSSLQERLYHLKDDGTGWDVDLELAINDVRSVLNTMLPEPEEDE